MLSCLYFPDKTLYLFKSLNSHHCDFTLQVTVIKYTIGFDLEDTRYRQELPKNLDLHS